MASLLRCFSSSSKAKNRDATPDFDKPIHCSDMDNLNLGIGLACGKMSVFIQESTKFPIKFIGIGKTSVDNQSATSLKVYEGESSLTRENILLGEIKLVGIPPAPKGVAKIKICFDVDVNGTLKVSAVHTVFSDLKNEITITTEQRRSAKTLDAKNKLRRYANGIKETLGDARYKGKMEEVDKKGIMKVANEAIEWLNENKSAAIYEYKGWQKKLQVLWNPIITKVHQDAAGPSLPLPLKVVEPLSSNSLDEVD